MARTYNNSTNTDKDSLWVEKARARYVRQRRQDMREMDMFSDLDTPLLRAWKRSRA